jgi:hypothetical protein
LKWIADARAALSARMCGCKISLTAGRLRKYRPMRCHAAPGWLNAGK